MLPAIRPSDQASILGFIAPISAGAGVRVSGWLDATLYHSILFIIQSGTMTATGTLDATIQQATSNTGTGAKSVYQNNNTAGTIKSITTFLAATNASNQAMINLRQEDLDIANGFKWVQFSITPAVAASQLAGLVLGFSPRQLGASSAIDANASLVQVV